MTDPKGIRNQDVRFVFSGLGTVTKCATKTTTCDDVIKKLPPQTMRISVYVSVNGVESELSGRTKILKVWRSHGSTANVHFVIKKSGGQKKSRVFKRKLFRGLYHKSKPKAYTRLVPEASKDTSDSNPNKTVCGLSLNSSFESLEDSIASIDVKGMFHLLKSEASAQEILAPTVANVSTMSLTRLNNRIVKDSLQTMKLGFKKSFASNESLHRSSSSDRVENIKCQAPFESDFFNNLRHSTPIIPASDKSVSRVRLPSSPHAVRLSSMISGKSRYNSGQTCVIDEFKADEIMSSTMRFNTSRDRPNRAGTPAFSSQEERCRYIWNTNCDSDSDSSFDSDNSSVESQLDMAFCDPSTSQNSNTIFDACEDESHYSFYPTNSVMADSHTSDFSFSSDESSFDDDDMTSYSRLYDSHVDSFMNTKSNLFHQPRSYQPGLHSYASKGERSEMDSDEGMGSMSSGSTSSFRERLLSLV